MTRDEFRRLRWGDPVDGELDFDIPNVVLPDPDAETTPDEEPAPEGS